jgi:alkylglycerol monooxygenase
MYLTAKTFNTLYQFWIHTETVRRLGPLEWVLNTPSHHRVHHAINPRYIDRNFGGILIVWDRLFGTYVPETETPVYGTVAPLSSWNPLWANVVNWVQLARMSRATGRLRDKLRVWVAPPEWRPDDLGGPVTIPEVRPGERRKYDTPATRGLDWYVGVQFGLAAVATTGFLLWQDTLPWYQLAAFGLVLLAALTSWGGLFERRRWALPLELSRHAAAITVSLWLTAGAPAAFPVTVATTVVSVVSALWLGWLVRPARFPAGLQSR